MSFNSSDMEAYREENPIPVLKQAYTKYQRNKRKAILRRAQTMANLRNVSSFNKPQEFGNSTDMRAQEGDLIRQPSVNLVLRQGDESLYDDPNKKVVFAHEFRDSLIEEELDAEAEAQEHDRVFEAYEGRVLDKNVEPEVQDVYADYIDDGVQAVKNTGNVIAEDLKETGNQLIDVGQKSVAAVQNAASAVAEGAEQLAAEAARL